MLTGAMVDCCSQAIMSSASIKSSFEEHATNLKVPFYNHLVTDLVIKILNNRLMFSPNHGVLVKFVFRHILQVHLIETRKHTIRQLNL